MCKRCDDYAADWEWVECTNVPACGWFGAVEVFHGKRNSCPACGHRVKDRRECEGCFEYPCTCGTYINPLCLDAAHPSLDAYNAVVDAEWEAEQRQQQEAA